MNQNMEQQSQNIFIKNYENTLINQEFRKNFNEIQQFLMTKY